MALCALLLILSLSTLTPSSADQTFIDQLCDQSMHVELCQATLSADGRSLSCGNVQCVAPVAVQHALQNVTDTRRRAQEMLVQKPPPPVDVVKGLVACVGVYSNVLVDIEQALADLGKGDYDASRKMLSNAGDESDKCEPAFATRPSPIIGLQTGFNAMLDIAWEVVDDAVGGRN